MAASSEPSALDFSSLAIRSHEKVIGMIQAYEKQAPAITPPDAVSLVLEKELVSLLKMLLYNTPHPISITYLNVHLTKDKIGMIDYQFLRKHLTLFSLLVIGEDLKIKLRDVPKYSVPPTVDSKSDLYLAHLSKDLKKVNDIIKSGFTELEVEAFYAKFKSNKYNIGLAFLIRNSHAFQLVACGNQVLVRCRSSLEASSDLISEENTLNAIEEHNFESFLAQRVASLLRLFGSSMSQGSLQQCFNFGSCKIDRRFWSRFQNMFFLNETNIELKPYNNDTESLPAADYTHSSPGVADERTHLARPQQMLAGHNVISDGMPDKSISSHSTALQRSQQDPVLKSAKSMEQKTQGDVVAIKESLKISSNNGIGNHIECREIGTNTTKQSGVLEVLDNSRSVLVINFDLSPTVEIAECMNNSDRCKALVAAREAIDTKIYELRDTRLDDLQGKKAK